MIISYFPVSSGEIAPLEDIHKRECSPLLVGNGGQVLADHVWKFNPRSVRVSVHGGVDAVQSVYM